MRSLRDVVPEQRHAASNRKNLDVENPPTRDRRQRKVRERPRVSTRQRIFDGSRELGPAEDGHRVKQWTAQRSFAWAVHHPFQGFVPERHPAVAIDDGHTLIQRFDDLPTAVLVFELVQVAAVRTVDAIKRDCGYGQDFPHAVVHDFCESDSEAGSDEVVRVPENRFRPESLDRLPVQERHQDLGRGALHEAVRQDGSRDWHSLPWPHVVGRDATERVMCQARCLRRDHDDDTVQERSADWTRALSVREPPCNSPGRCDEQRRVSTKEEQRAEVDEKGRRHDPAVLRGRRPYGERRGQNRGQGHTGEFENPMRLWPAR